MWQKAKNIYHLLVAIAANSIFQFPSRKLTVIGITGTDGKTTTSSLIYHILKSSGKKVSLISTISAIIDGKKYDTGFHVTNPASIPLQKFIQKATFSNQEYLVLEVTSHGIDQNRIWGIPFAIAGITNVSHEHLDYHKTYENYVRTKAKLLQRAKVAVINRDDKSYHLISKLLGSTKKTITYGLGENAQVNETNTQFESHLPGKYNVYNTLLAFAISKELGLTDKEIQHAIRSFQLPSGRTEIVYKGNVTVMIDFAHTPNAFAQLLPAIKPKNGRLIHIFGSAGLRDKTKRPKMGEEAAKNDDIIILTAEDPRTEKITDINSDIKKKISNFQFAIFNKEKTIQLYENRKYLFEIPDRQEAINTAIQLAKKGDMIVLTGKGHEKSMNLGNGEESWDEFAAVKKALTLRK